MQSSNQGSRRGFVWGLLIVSCSYPGSRASGQDASKSPPILQKIMATWKDRQDRTHSFRFSWTERQFWRKGSIQGSSVGPNSPENGPFEDTVHTVPHTFVVAGSSWRYTSRQYQWSPKLSAWYEQPTMSRFNGTAIMRLRQPGGPSDFPVATIAHSRLFSEARLRTVWPINLNYRFFDPAFLNHNTNSFVPTQLTGRIGEHSCIILHRVDRNAKSVTSIWVLPTKGFPIARYSQTYNNIEHLRIDITYKNDANGEPVPADWNTIVSSETGALLQTYDSTIQDYSLNTPVLAEDIDFALPPRTMLFDETKSPPVSYYVKNDGSQRTIQGQDDRAESLDQYEYTEPGQALSYRKWWPTRIWFRVLAVVAIGGALISALVRWRKSRMRIQFPT